MATYKTVEDIINAKDRYDLNKITFFTMSDDKDLVVPDTDLFQIYMGYIAQFIARFKCSYAVREKYRYKPYLMSQDIYGTPELGWLILLLNDRECASKFTIKSTIRLVPQEYLVSLYDTIVTKSNTKLKKNWDEFLTQVTE